MRGCLRSAGEVVKSEQRRQTISRSRVISISSTQVLSTLESSTITTRVAVERDGVETANDMNNEARGHGTEKTKRQRRTGGAKGSGMNVCMYG